MEVRNYKYDAFISYRHTELDMYVAENLIKQLEADKLPKSVAKKLAGKKTKIKRVFRDREELPLTNNLEEPIVEALKNSEWLLVICSPRLPESVWCKKEIETFISLRGRDHVLAVLIEGEPSDSFPEELLYKIVEVETPDGTTELIRETVEPLAADFRGKDGADKKGVAKAMKTEILRVLAAMFGVEYDDLRQRQKERKMRRIMTASLLVTAVCLAFGIYSTMTASRIKAQNERIELQSTQILKQSQDIQSKSEEILKQNDEITKQNEALALRQALTLAEQAAGYYESGDRENAAKTALEALTECDGIEMPYTPEAEYVLAGSTGAYDTGQDYKATYQYEMSGKIEYMDISPDGRVVALIDATGNLVLYDLEKREELGSVIKRDSNDLYNNQQVFLQGDRLAYVDLNHKIAIYDTKEKKVIQKLEPDYVSGVYADQEGKYLVVKESFDEFVLYEGDTLQNIATIPGQNIFYDSCYVFSEGVVVLEDSSYVNEEKEVTLYIYNIESEQWIKSCSIGNKEIRDIQSRNGVAYALMYGYDGILSYAYVMAISLEGGEVLWENVMQGQYQYINNVYLPTMEDGNELVCDIDNNAVLMDMQTGNIVYSFPLGSSISLKYSSKNNNYWYFILKNGIMATLSVEYKVAFDMSDRFQCKSSRISNAFQASEYGIVIQEAYDNKFTVYTTVKGPNVKEVSEEVKAPELPKSLWGSSAIDLAHFYKLERSDFISKMYHSKDAKYCIVYYWDGDMAVFDMEQRKILNVIEAANDTDGCLGPDAEGYVFIGRRRLLCVE